MTQEQIIDILNMSQQDFKGINEANLDSAEVIMAVFEKHKLKFAIEQLKQIESHYKGSAFGMVQSKIKELEQKFQEQ